MKKILLGLFAIGIMVSACKKEKGTPAEEGGEGTILTEVKYWTPSTGKATKISGIALDASGKITAFETFGSNGAAMYKYDSFEKDGAGKVIKVSGKNISNSNTAVTIDFTYTGNNITKTVKTEGIQLRTSEYTYDASNRIILIENFVDGTKTIRKTWSYTGADVNHSSEKQEVVSYNPVQVTNNTYKYDDKNNPYLKIDRILFFMGGGDLRTHNVIQTNTSPLVKYVYNASGYPISQDYTTDAGMKFTYK